MSSLTIYCIISRSVKQRLGHAHLGFSHDAACKSLNVVSAGVLLLHHLDRSSPLQLQSLVTGVSDS